jgi:glycosyltransferase involved in cell wall biosynthesis
MIVFIWRRQPPPGFIGGAELTEAAWAAALAELGHKVLFVGCHTNPRDHRLSDLSALREMLRYHGISVEIRADRLDYEWRGVRCICVSRRDLMQTARAILATRPRMLWTSQEGCDEIASLRSVKTFLVSYAHSVSPIGILSAKIGADFVLAPSIFVQRFLRDRLGCQSALLRPAMDRPSHAELPRDTVLFVNPIREKGVVLAAALARAFPLQRFCFVEAWRTSDIEPDCLPANVELLPRQPSLDQQYARAMLLLVPSVIADAAPRVIDEAGLRGVPVLGSHRGGISELVAQPETNCFPSWGVSRWSRRMAALLQCDRSREKAADAQRQLTQSLFEEPADALGRVGILRVLQ